MLVPNVQMAGKTGTAQVHNDSAAEKAKNFNAMRMAWQDRPDGLFVGFAPYDNPRYATAVIVEHGNWGALSAAPIARDLLSYAVLNDPAGRDTPISPQPIPIPVAPPITTQSAGLATGPLSPGPLAATGSPGAGPPGAGPAATPIATVSATTAAIPVQTVQ